ncbi:MarR family winged helix-turn-helix transcriptional regulator [Wenjunlia tyrosinilytica]|uniref:Transcription regulator protein, MarR n=1 Tax=Wenjunlia tyrosinilytica TaxID=1544741 RepID=A0A918DZF9_9ACTN|nr:MarR family transcriptional regulator [Wenjunlia tyrosinilytica]GGO89955.1 putative transcription regulator protein, MarR [Wenjunlia tyrosinilytica]
MTTPQPITDATREAVDRIWAGMRSLVLSDDRRGEVSEALGMSFIRSKALRRLVGGPLTMRELTERLSTDKPYTTLVVDDLERRGLVVRSVHPDDRRSRVVTITEEGAAAAARAEEILARPPEAMRSLAPEELEALDRMVGKLAEAARTAEGTQGAGAARASGAGQRPGTG